MAFFWMVLNDPNIQALSIGIAVFFVVKYIFKRFFNVSEELHRPRKESKPPEEGTINERIENINTVKKEPNADKVE